MVLIFSHLKHLHIYIYYESIVCSVETLFIMHVSNYVNIIYLVSVAVYAIVYFRKCV